MRHRQSRLRLRHKPAHSRGLQRNLVTSLLLYETIRTTKKRAEVIQPVVDRIITVAKTRAPHVAIRYINGIVTHKNASRKTMEVLKGRYAKRSSGFTRLVPLGARHGDGAKMVSLELIDAVVSGADTTSSVEKSTKKTKSTKSSSSSSSLSSSPKK